MGKFDIRSRNSKEMCLFPRCISGIKKGDVIWEIQLCSSVAPGGCCRFLGVCEKQETLLALFGSCVKVGEMKVFWQLPIELFTSFKSATQCWSWWVGVQGRSKKTKTTYYKSRLSVCTIPCKSKSPHLLQFYILKSYIPLSSLLLNIKDTGKN